MYQVVVLGTRRAWEGAYGTGRYHRRQKQSKAYRHSEGCNARREQDTTIVQGATRRVKTHHRDKDVLLVTTSGTSTTTHLSRT